MVEVTRIETVGEGGVLQIILPESEAGKTVEVTVRDTERRVYRTIGGYEGKIRIAPDFDDPLPEMEPYS